LGGDNIGGEEEKHKLTLVVYVHDIKVKLEVIPIIITELFDLEGCLQYLKLRMGK